MTTTTTTTTSSRRRTGGDGEDEGTRWQGWEDSERCDACLRGESVSASVCRQDVKVVRDLYTSWMSLSVAILHACLTWPVR